MTYILLGFFVLNFEFEQPWSLQTTLLHWKYLYEDSSNDYMFYSMQVRHDSEQIKTELSLLSELSL